MNEISSSNTEINSGGTYSIADNFSGTIRINTSDAVTLDGTGAGELTNVKIVTTAASADLTIKNLIVSNDSDSVIKFGSSAANNLTITGTNSLKTSDTWAAVVNGGGGLSVDGEGKLNVTAGSQGAGIGFDSFSTCSADLTINSGYITTSTSMGAGIGSGSSGSLGNITINGGNISATSTYGAGLGSGARGSVALITINGGSLSADGYAGAGVGSGAWLGSSVVSIIINGGSIYATNSFGAGVGSGNAGNAGSQ